MPKGRCARPGTGAAPLAGPVDPEPSPSLPTQHCGALRRLLYQPNFDPLHGRSAAAQRLHRLYRLQGAPRNRVPANLGVVKAQVGDWVLVHAGLVIQVLSESQAQEMNNLLAELETLL